jgi:hypothetical protein
MALQRHYLDQLMLSLFDKEATYGAGPGGWTGTSACSMLDFEDASAHADWDDTIQADTDVITGREFISVQELVRQSVRLTYTEPRVKPNTLAGLMGLCLGTVATTQDGTETAYRHKITKAASVSLPSIGAQIKYEGGDQREMRGLKGESWTLQINGPYLQFSCQMIGSGYREPATTAFAAKIAENWLRLGDAQFFIKDTAGTPITVPASPAQGSANLGGGEVNFSTRVRSFSLTWTNNLAAEAGYRASTGLLRGNFHPVRRTATLSLGFDVDSASEATELAYYLSQAKLAFELNLNSGLLIDPDGTFKYGLIVIVPRLQLTRLPRSQQDQFEVLTMEGTVLDDGTNSELIAYVYNARPTYLA